MANRYWVGGTADWDGTAGSKWSTTSGGGGGSAVPTAADDVFLDGNSGAVTVSIKVLEAKCRSLDATGFTGTLADPDQWGLLIGDGTVGHTVFGSGMTLNTFPFFVSTTGPNNITTNGVTLPSPYYMQFSGAGGSWVLQDALTVSGGSGIIHTAGTLDTNGKAVTCTKLSSTGAITRALTFGASTITLDGNSTVLNITGSNLTLTANTSTIVVSDTSASAKTIVGGSKTFNDITLTGGGTGEVQFSGNITINTLAIGTPKNVSFSAVDTFTFSSLTATATALGDIDIYSDTPGSAANFSDSSGANTVYRCTIQDIAASGGAGWSAISSTNVSGNSGWNFGSLGGMFNVFK